MNKKMYVIMGVIIMILFTGVSCSISTDKSDSSLPKEDTEQTTTEKINQEQQKVEATQETTSDSVITTSEKIAEKPIEQTVATSTIKTRETITLPTTKTGSTIISCGLDEVCLLKNIQSCTPATGQIQFLMLVLDVSITNAGNNCIIRHTAKSGLEGEFASWIGKYYDCTFTKDELKQNVNVYSEKALGSPIDYCTGTYIDAMKKFMNGGATEMYPETWSVGVSMTRDDGKIMSLKAIESATGPATITVDSESATFNIGETKTVNGHTITLKDIIPQTCTIDGVKKEGKDCGTTNLYRASLIIK
ncbi:MAG: hypothetical protein WA057_00385 [Candidatus Magasanikiibacteriota bacterium]